MTGLFTEYEYAVGKAENSRADKEVGEQVCDLGAKRRVPVSCMPNSRI